MNSFAKIITSASVSVPVSFSVIFSVTSFISSVIFSSVDTSTVKKAAWTATRCVSPSPTATILTQKEAGTFTLGFLAFACVGIALASGSWARTPHSGRLKRQAPPLPPPPPPPPSPAQNNDSRNGENDEQNPGDNNGNTGGDGDGDPLQDAVTNVNDADTKGDGLSTSPAPAPEDPPPPPSGVDADDKDKDSNGRSASQGGFFWLLVIMAGSLGLKKWTRSVRNVNAQPTLRPASTRISGLLKRPNKEICVAGTPVLKPTPTRVLSGQQVLQPLEAIALQILKDIALVVVSSEPSRVLSTITPSRCQPGLASWSRTWSFLVFAAFPVLWIVGSTIWLLLFVANRPSSTSELGHVEDIVLDPPDPPPFRAPSVSPPSTPCRIPLPLSAPTTPATSTPTPQPQPSSCAPTPTPQARKAAHAIGYLKARTALRVAHRAACIRAAVEAKKAELEAKGEKETGERRRAIAFLKGRITIRIARDERETETDAGQRERRRRVRAVQREVWRKLVESRFGGRRGLRVRGRRIIKGSEQRASNTALFPLAVRYPRGHSVRRRHIPSFLFSLFHLLPFPYLSPTHSSLPLVAGRRTYCMYTRKCTLA
ncbi:hypothetical protein MSAN_02144700 [Mycena sanguinolenta]|uniref:Transmembrane protein n=1 Tax=Mycena sanguinolenta TaxID=230812 RepID=A0A8H7CKA7_9AGAR|nr:hypothetical protein MSAN_02144700 [Mycena sanguinolenta]